MGLMEQILHLINEMSPFLLLGFLLAGLMHAFIPGQIYSRYLAKPTFSSVLYAALFGVPLPLCSCGVIPTAMSLRREGASKGAVASFLIASGFIPHSNTTDRRGLYHSHLLAYGTSIRNSKTIHSIPNGIVRRTDGECSRACRCY